MNTAFKTVAAGLLLAGAAVSASAATQVFAGALDDPGNLVLVGGSFGNGLGAPDFSSSDAIADNVALYEFDVTSAGPVSIVSTGYATGGVDPYFSLFAGSGGGATFLASNHDQVYGTGGDFTFTSPLAVGHHRIALGASANMSMAETLEADGEGRYSLTLMTSGGAGRSPLRCLPAAGARPGDAWRRTAYRQPPTRSRASMRR